MVKEKKFYLTKEGLDKLNKECQELKNLRISKTRGDVPKIWQSEDLNPEYLVFQEDLSFLDSRITELDYVLKNSAPIKAPPKEKQDIVDLGATVTLEESDGQINEFMIVGTLEANPGEGKISAESPVGKTLLGKKVGEEVMITSPIKVVYKLKEVKYELS